MKGMLLEIPEEVVTSAKIPRGRLESELRRRLAAALFTEAVIGGAAACKLAGMGKAEFQHWMGEQGISQPLEWGDYETERDHLESWMRNG